MFSHHTPGELSLPTRRKFLQQVGHGFGSLALAAMLNERTRATATNPPIIIETITFTRASYCCL